MTPEQLAEQLKDRDEFIDNLFIALQAIRNNQYAEIMPLLERTYRERNDLERLLIQSQGEFQKLSLELKKCREITEHFRV